MRNITLLGTAVAALTATMLLVSPASAQRGCREVCVDGNCRMHCSPRGEYRDRDHYGDRSHRGDMYMYAGRNRDHYRELSTTATADPEYTFMYLESAASNWATNILVGHRIGPRDRA